VTWVVSRSFVPGLVEGEARVLEGQWARHQSKSAVRGDDTLRENRSKVARCQKRRDQSKGRHVCDDPSQCSKPVETLVERVSRFTTR
jgi:hypothetical protein